MAAVLCNGIGDLCNGVCTGIQTVACIPCRACGYACENIGDVISTPFFLDTAVAFVFNVPQIVFAFQSNFEDDAGGDCGNVIQWLNVNAALCAAHIIATLYIAKAIQEEGRFGDNDENYISRVKKVLCYDPWVAVYILIFIFFLIWQSIGMARLFGSGCGTQSIQGKLFKSLILNWLFLSLGTVAFVCSICCAGARDTVDGSNTSTPVLADPSTKYSAAEDAIEAPSAPVAPAIVVPSGKYDAQAY